MKKVIAVVFTMMAGVASLVAQNTRTVHGYVIDKDGNPIVGAEVSAPGGGDAAITDSDGSFTLSVSPFLKKLTANYAGMGEKKLDVNFEKDMLFTLKPEKKHPFFLGLSMGIGVATDCYDGHDYEHYFAWSPSIMAGQLGKWGWYGKISYTGIDYGYQSNFSVIGGAVKSLVKNKCFLNFGVGYGNVGVTEYYTQYFDNWTNSGYSDNRYSGVALDLGVIIKPWEHWMLTVGFTPTLVFEDFNYSQYIGSIGFGYVF